MPKYLRQLLVPVDIICASCIAVSVWLWGIYRNPFARRSEAKGRRLLVLDTAYSLYTLTKRAQLSTIFCRDLDGFFDHVTTVHPLVGADPREPETCATGPVRVEALSPRHTVIENPIRPGRIGRSLPRLAFLLNQRNLLRHLDRVIKSDSTSVIRAGDPHYQGLIATALTRRNAIPLVIRIGGNIDAIHAQTGALAYPRILPNRRIEKIVERYSLKRADLVVGANQDNLEYAIANGAARERTSVFRYGNLVAPVHFSVPESRTGGAELLSALGIDPEHPVLLFVGRLEPVKHVRDLIEVHALVRRRHPDAQLLIVGDGTERPAMESLARELQSERMLFFAGDRAQDWIAKAAPHTDVVVATHMGRALVETALGGVPVAGYDHDWHGELVEDGKEGYLVQFGDKIALAEAIDGLLGDVERTYEMGRRIRSKAHEMMHPDRLNAHEREAYRTILSPRTRTKGPDRPEEVVEA